MLWVPMLCQCQGPLGLSLIRPLILLSGLFKGTSGVTIHQCYPLNSVTGRSIQCGEIDD